MPYHNRFRHQPYHIDAHGCSIEWLSPPTPPAVESEVGRECLSAAGLSLRKAEVRTIYLLHGTFVGTDALGLIRGIARAWPDVADVLYRAQKHALDMFAGDAGNFTPQYAADLEQALNRGLDSHSRIPVRLFHWSGENHHVGRADGAVRLIDDLASRPDLRGGRVLLCGHSHGGNVLALVSNLLANDQAANREFFDAAIAYYRWPLWGRTDIKLWERVRQLIESESRPLAEVSLDMVTLGTPVRYGWDLGGCSKLLHFINHRPDGGPRTHLAAFPAAVEDILAAIGGDYVQQLGIAGTDAFHPFWAWRAWRAERKLARLLQPGLRLRHTLQRLKLGVRLHQDGLNLLVDYGLPGGHIGQHLAGHAVYTRRAWMPFHFEEIARHFYRIDEPSIEK
jgi:hypothetical protein